MYEKRHAHSCPFRDMPWYAVPPPAATPSTTYHGTFYGIARNIPRTSTVYHGTLPLTPTLVPWTLGCSRGCHHIYAARLPWNAVAVAAGVAMVPPMACHGTPHGDMEPYATPSDAVGRPWYSMGSTMAMPRNNQLICV